MHRARLTGTPNAVLSAMDFVEELGPGTSALLVTLATCAIGAVPDRQVQAGCALRSALKAGTDAIPTATLGWMFEYLPGVKELKFAPFCSPI